ncbi:hypothetical protein Tco_1510713, partial [Tanacetum coccineum]
MHPYGQASAFDTGTAPVYDTNTPSEEPNIDAHSDTKPVNEKFHMLPHKKQHSELPESTQ